MGGHLAFQNLLQRYLLDPMHCEKNFCENILKTIFGEKDTINVRKDMEIEGIRSHLWLRPDPNRPGKVLMPAASYVLTKSEQEDFLKTLGAMKVPTGFSGAFQKHAINKKWSGMKSHDLHVMMQQILPVCIRGTMAPGPRTAIMRVSRVFRKICAKVWDPRDITSLHEDVAMTLCLLEKEFPPSFFDVMTHLLVHLVEELHVCGPVASRWMYPMERYMKDLKGYVRNMARPEGSMAEGYIRDEALGFMTEYMSSFDAIQRRVWDENEEEGVVGEVLEGGGTKRAMSPRLRDVAHDYVLNNTTTMTPWRQWVPTYIPPVLFLMVFVCWNYIYIVTSHSGHYGSGIVY